MIRESIFSVIWTSEEYLDKSEEYCFDMHKSVCLIFPARPRALNNLFI